LAPPAVADWSVAAKSEKTSHDKYSRVNASENDILSRRVALLAELTFSPDQQCRMGADCGRRNVDIISVQPVNSGNNER
jgi:hypothetical protein